MDKSKTSHDILNLLERLRIMHDLLKDQSFGTISKEELLDDLNEALKLIAEKFKILSQ